MKPAPLIRWSIKKISEEFGEAAATITKKIKCSGISPGDDGRYSTMDVKKALIDPLSEKLKLAHIEDTQRAAAMKKVKTENLLKENVPLSLVEKVWSDFVVDLRQKIQSSSLPPKERADILGDLQTIPVENYFVNLEAKEESDEE